MKKSITEDFRALNDVVELACFQALSESWQALPSFSRLAMSIQMGVDTPTRRLFACR
jgi:hypothetical protein